MICNILKNLFFINHIWLKSHLGIHLRLYRMFHQRIRMYVLPNCCFKLHFHWYLVELLFFFQGKKIKISYEYLHANVNLKLCELQDEIKVEYFSLQYNIINSILGSIALFIRPAIKACVLIPHKFWCVESSGTNICKISANGKLT